MMPLFIQFIPCPSAPREPAERSESFRSPGSCGAREKSSCAINSSCQIPFRFAEYVFLDVDQNLRHCFRSLSNSFCPEKKGVFERVGNGI